MRLDKSGATSVMWAIMLLSLFALITACDNSTSVTLQTPVAIQATITSGPIAQPTSGALPTILAKTVVENTPTIITTATVEVDTVATPSATLMPLAQRENEFQQVWTTVKLHYLYADFRGIDWDKTHDIYEKKVADASSASEFYADLSDMIGLLKDDHSRFISPEEAQQEDHMDSGTENYAGIGISSFHSSNSTLILQVFPGSPAEGAGLRRRDRILAIDGNPITAENDASLRGPVGTKVRLSVQSPGEQPRDITIVRQKVTGKILASSSRLTANSTIGYLLIPSLWADDMSAQVEQQLASLLKGPPLKGLVMDVRSNEGGWSTVLTGILGQFVKGDVGQFYSQRSSRPLEPTSGDLYVKLKSVPLVVLVDKKSESYAEVLTAALQASGRAKVVGTTSAGNTETVYAYNFADKSRLWVAQEGYKLPDGTNLEGRGVIPDNRVDVDWTQYSLEKDPQVLEAVKLVTK